MDAMHQKLKSKKKKKPSAAATKLSSASKKIKKGIRPSVYHSTPPKLPLKFLSNNNTTIKNLSPTYILHAQKQKVHEPIFDNSIPLNIRALDKN